MSGASADDPARLTVRFEGRVQGVGFRWTVRRLASIRDVTGSVRNEDDGTVTVKAEGPRWALLGLLGDIRASRPGAGVVSERLAWSGATGCFRGFEIDR